jgi:hypothetical protein
MKRIAILQSNYIPWKGYFDIIAHSDVFVLYDEVQFTKNDWRNRNLIKTLKGLEWLTIPVRQHSLTQKIEETHPANTAWPRKHWASLSTNYARTPYFREMEPLVRRMYETAPVDSLSSINIHFIRGICDILGIGTQIINSRDLDLCGDRNERLVDAVSKLGGTHYLSGPSAQGYLDVEMFHEKAISVEWMDYSGYAEYPQNHPPFEHGVTILDLLFNTGRSARRYLRCPLDVQTAKTS